MRRKIACILALVMLPCQIALAADIIPEEDNADVSQEITSGNDGDTVSDVPGQEEIPTTTEIPAEPRESIAPTVTEEPEKEEFPKEETEESKKTAAVYNVSFPTSTKAYLDPENLSGKGQIFSEEYKVENYGNIDVAIQIKNIEVYYWGTEDIYEFAEDTTDFSTEKTSADFQKEGFQVEDSRPVGVKRLNVDIIWQNESERSRTVLDVTEGAPEEYVLSLKASSYDDEGNFLELNSGSTGGFYFTGTLDADPGADWSNGEVRVHFDYEIVSTEPVTDAPEEDFVNTTKEELSEEISEIETPAADKEEIPTETVAPFENLEEETENPEERLPEESTPEPALQPEQEQKEE